jgi:hypothetical protein
MSVSILDNLCRTSAINRVVGKADTQLYHIPIQPDKRNLFQLLCLSVCQIRCSSHTKHTCGYFSALGQIQTTERQMGKCARSNVECSEKCARSNVECSGKCAHSNVECSGKCAPSYDECSMFTTGLLTVCLTLVRLHKILLGVQFDSISYEDGVPQHSRMSLMSTCFVSRKCLVSTRK